MQNYYDVIIIGGGTSGIVAAIAAARNGARTLVVEKYGFLGGTAIHGYPFLAFFSCDGKKIIGGIPEEIVQRLIKEGGSPGHIKGGKWRKEGNYEFSLTPYEPEIFKYIAQEMIIHEGADILFHSFLLNTIIEDNKVIGVELLNKSGRQSIYGKVFIDSTGDGDLAYLSGAEFQEIDKNKVNNVTMSMYLRNINLEEMLNTLKKDSGIIGWEKWHTRVIMGPKLNQEKHSIVHLAGHMDLFDNKPPLTFTAVSWIEGEASFNITRTINIDATNVFDLTKAEISERRNVIDVFKKCKEKIPGMSNCILGSTSPQVGIRESRRIKGLYTLKVSDAVECKNFDDGIARGGYPLDRHDPKGGPTQFTFLKDGGSFSIPYRCLVSKNIESLLVSGRCISTDQMALNAVRLQSACMATGQAAGTAAALCIKNNISPENINIENLRTVLKSQKVIL